MTDQQDKLEVRIHHWQQTGPRVEYRDGKAWKPCRDLNAARAAAERLGLDGIRVKPV